MSPCEVRVGRPGRGPDALDVPDHARNFDVVAQPGKFRHQRDARPGGRRHRTRARPACANHHADGRQFVFRLHDREGRLAIRTDAMLLHVVDQRLNQRRRRRNRIPRHHRHAREHAAQRRRGVAVDDDLARGLVHALDAERILLLQIRRGVVVACLRRAQVQIRRLHLLRELLADRLLDLVHVDVEQLRHDADVDHVLDQLAQLGFRTDRRHQLVVGHRIERQIVAQFVQLQRLVVEHGGAGRERHHVLLRGFRVHRHQEVDFLLARDVAVLVGANGVPGRKSGNVRREKILARNRNAHLENAAQKHRVGTLRARPVDRRDLNAHVVDDRFALQAPAGVLQRHIGSSHPCPSFGTTGLSIARVPSLHEGENPQLYGKSGRCPRLKAYSSTGVPEWQTMLQPGKTGPCCGIYYIVTRAIPGWECP